MAFTLCALNVSCSVKITRVSNEVRQYVKTMNVKPADSTCEQIIAGARQYYDPIFVYIINGVPSPDTAARIFQLTALQEILPFLQFPDTLVTGLALDRRELPPMSPADSEFLGIREKDFDRRFASASRQAREAIPRAAEWDATVSFIIDRSGRVDSLRPSTPSVIPAVHQPLVDAVSKASASGNLPPVPDNLPAPQRFDVHLSLRREADSSLAAFDTVWMGVRRVRRLLWMSARPRFPAPLAARGLDIADEVWMSFIVDIDSLMRPGSMRILSGRYPMFVEEAKRRMQQMTFRPAEYRGCPVSVQTRGAVTFER